MVTFVVIFEWVPLENIMEACYINVLSVFWCDPFSCFLHSFIFSENSLYQRLQLVLYVVLLLLIFSNRSDR